MEVAVKLRNLAQTKQGAEQYCWKVGFIFNFEKCVYQDHIMPRWRNWGKTNAKSVDHELFVSQNFM